MVDPLLLSAVRISTFYGETEMTNASGFFFESTQCLFLVSSRHVFFDEATDHRPDSVKIQLHIDSHDLACCVTYSIPLYKNGMSLWRQAADLSSEVDVAVIEIDSNAFPADALYTAFSSEHIYDSLDAIDIGTPMLIVGFPLGFHDTLHQLPVVRHAINASPLGFRFQGMGYFLTDARTHRGTSGAAVVMKSGNPEAQMPWTLLGIHSARLDVGTRDVGLDEALGLNCAWFADVLVPLTSNSSR